MGGGRGGGTGILVYPVRPFPLSLSPVYVSVSLSLSLCISVRGGRGGGGRRHSSDYPVRRLSSRGQCWHFVCSTLTRIAQNDFYPIMYMHISYVGLCVQGFMNPMPS